MGIANLVMGGYLLGVDKEPIFRPGGLFRLIHVLVVLVILVLMAVAIRPVADWFVHLFM